MINLNNISLGANDLNTYKEKGYFITDKLLQNSELEKLRKSFYRIFDNDYDRDIYPFDRVYNHDLDNKLLLKLNNGWWVNDEIRSIVLSPIIGKIMAFFMETSEVRVWHDQIVLKRGVGNNDAETDGNIGWHQDYAHWQVSSSTNMATIWIALQDTNLENGGMRTIVGSHKWGLQKDADNFHERDLKLLEDKYKDNHKWIDEPCIIKAGHASIHHSLCFHGSGPNKSNNDRLGLIIHCMPKGASYRGRINPKSKFKLGSKGNRHANVPLLGPNAKKGDYFEGENFPVIWPYDKETEKIYNIKLDKLKQS